MTRHPIWSTLSILFVLSFTTVANAQSSPSKADMLDEDFDSLISQAQEAFTSDNFAAALDLLLMANRQEPDSRLLLNIARSHEQMNNCRAALSYYAAFLRHPEAEEQLFEVAESAIEAGADACLAYDEALGGRLIIESDPLLASVFIDDQPVGLTPVETIALTPGKHIIRFELDGYQEHVEEINIESAKDQTLGVTLQLPAEPDASEKPIVAPITPEEPKGFSPNPIALGLAGGGAALLITGLILDLGVVPSIDEQRAEAAADPDRFAELTESRQNYVTGFLTSYIAGGLLLVGSGAWIIYDYVALTSDDGENDASRYVVAPSFSEEGATLNLLGRF